MAKELDQDQNDFIDIDIAGETTEEQPAQKPEETGAERSVKKVEKVAEDPLAVGDVPEDVYSGHYRRDSADTGVYTGETISESVTDSAAAARERANRVRRRRQEKNRRTLIIVVLILLVAACLLVLAMRAMKLGPFSEPVLTVPEETEAEETSAEPSTEETEAGEESTEISWEKDGSPEILELVKEYYTALVADDEETLLSILDASVPSVSVNDSVEEYQDIVTYVTEGAQEGEYAVYITYSLKFKDIETTAPGLLPAYVKTDEEGVLRYLPYVSSGFSYDDEVQSYMNSISGSEQILALNEEVSAAYTQALENDEALNTFIESLSPEETPAIETAGTEETAAAEETTAAEPTFEEVDDIQYTTSDAVNLRDTPSLDGDPDVQLSLGTKVHVTAVSDEWCRVTLMDGSGAEGYIYKQYLSVDAPETAAAADEDEDEDEEE